MLISVIMPTFHQDRYISESIRSVLNQTHKNLELIIVPVYGDDLTLRKIKKFNDPRIRVILSNYAMITHQMNLGSFAAQGKYTTYVGSDDVMFNDGLEKVATVAKDKSAVLVRGNFYTSDANLENLKKYTPAQGLMTDNTLVKRKEHLNYLPLEFSKGKWRTENVWQKMLAEPKYKERIFYLPDFLMIYRQHGKSIHKKITASQHRFCSVTIGDNPDLKYFQKILGIKKINSKPTDDQFCTYITEPSVFLNNQSNFRFKRVITHWDQSNIDQLEPFLVLSNIYNITHDHRIYDILSSKNTPNCKIFTKELEIIDYVGQDTYMGLQV